MKRCLMLVLAVGLTAAAATTAAAQTSSQAPLARSDMAATIGWLNGHKPSADPYGNAWYNHALHGGGSVGWYWSDHLKTEIEAGASNTAHLYRYRPATIGGIPTYQSSELDIRTSRLALGQQYQFLRNAWVHPHLGAGLDLTWERTAEHIDAITTYDSQGRNPRELRPAITIGPETRLRVRPFAEAGFKAYMSRRAFFRAGMRLAFHGGVDEVIMRCGFGVDF